MYLAVIPLIPQIPQIPVQTITGLYSDCPQSYIQNPGYPSLEKTFGSEVVVLSLILSRGCQLNIIIFQLAQWEKHRVDAVLKTAGLVRNTGAITPFITHHNLYQKELNYYKTNDANISGNVKNRELKKNSLFYAFTYN